MSNPSSDADVISNDGKKLRKGSITELMHRLKQEHDATDDRVARTVPVPVPPTPLPPKVELSLSSLLARFRATAISIGLMSGLINLLYLTGSLFMLQVYDRVIPSRSVATLVALATLTAGLYMFQAALDFIRGRVLTRVAASLDAELTDHVFALVTTLPLSRQSDQPQPLRDLDGLRAFIMGTGPTTFFDLPWIPIYLGLCFVFHPFIGWAVVFGIVVLASVALATELQTRRPVQQMSGLGLRRSDFAEAGRRNASVINAMGMGPALTRVWNDLNRSYMIEQQRASDVGGLYAAISKFVRLALQSGVLALGAFLVINDQATGGVIIASSVLTSRALAPVELAIANWRSFVAARQSARRLFKLLANVPTGVQHFALPAPFQSLDVEALCVAAPNQAKLIVKDVSLRLRAGDGLGIIGPSASGKSSLIRALVGVWAPVRGTVRLDNATLAQWEPSQLGRHVGYLPQEVELFSGTVADNIARFSEPRDDAAVIAAAQAAEVHDLILKLPDGYKTQVGPEGAFLSAGQKQRIGLARALYGQPFLVVLDEPNSNLDLDGEEALTRALTGLRARRAIVIVVAHRGSALAALNQVLVMGEGSVQAFGPKAEVLQSTLRTPVPPVAPTIAATQGIGKIAS